MTSTQVVIDSRSLGVLSDFGSSYEALVQIKLVIRESNINWPKNHLVIKLQPRLVRKLYSGISDTVSPRLANFTVSAEKSYKGLEVLT